MLQAAVISFLALVSVAAHAGTQVVFAKDGTKVTVFMMALTQNPDAIKFNDALAAPVEDIQGKWTKKASYVDPQGVDAFNALCSFSKVAPGTGSCVLVFKASKGLRMEPARSAFRLEATADEAPKLAKLFVGGEAGGELFRSSDGHLSVARAGLGTAADHLVVEYH